MKYSKTKVIATITALIFIVPTVLYSFKKFQEKATLKKFSNSKYQIDTIIQTGLQKEALPTLYLAELLDLSVDQPQSFADLSEAAFEEKLRLSPLIKTAKVKKTFPSTIYIDYEIRSPIAVVADFTNSGMDREGNIFPLYPFFAPRKLPQIYFGLKDLPKRIEGEKLELALRLLEMLENQNLIYLSVADATHQSCGKREIVVVFDHAQKKHYLRLSTKNYPQELGNYLTIKDQFSKKTDQVIDLRIANLAYLEEIPHE